MSRLATNASTQPASGKLAAAAQRATRFTSTRSLSWDVVERLAYESATSLSNFTS